MAPQGGQTDPNRRYRPHYTGTERRFGRPKEYRHMMERRERRRELKPMPIKDRCNPLCPFFKCSKNALVTVNKVVKGHVQKAAMCRWIGDQCLGPKCQFSYCERKALLPDGRCAFAVKFRESGDEFLKELEKDEVNEKVKTLLSKRVGRREEFLE